jgi:hypothetical protein
MSIHRLIVFLPLLAAIIAGLRPRFIGKTRREGHHHRRAVPVLRAELADLPRLS